MTGESKAGRGSDALRRFLIGDDNLDDALAKLAAIAAESIPPVDIASITVLRNGKPMTPASTDHAALALDGTQYEAGDGPCLAAIRESGIVEIAIGADDRWPEFDHAATQAGVRSTLSVALQSDDHEAIGGLNLYSRTTDRFDAEHRNAATELAGEIAVAVANVLTYHDAATLARQLQEALKSRATIEQAKGVLMAAQRCSPEEAFDMLRRASQRENRKLRDVAAAIVERTQLP